VPTTVFVQDSHGTQKNSGLFLMVYQQLLSDSASASQPLPTQMMEVLHLIQKCFHLGSESHPILCLETGTSKVTAIPQLQKHFFFPHLSQRDLTSHKFCSRTRGKDCAQTCILHSPRCVPANNSLHEKISISVTNSKCTVGSFLLQPSGMRQNQF